MQSPTTGQQVKLLKTAFSPEAIGTVQDVRGYGTLQAIEAETLPNQPGARLRVAFVGQWELMAPNQSEGGES